MKKIKNFITLLLVFISGPLIVSADETNYYIINKNNIKINEIEYNNLINLGFTRFEIENMTQNEYDMNKGLKGICCIRNNRILHDYFPI